MGHRVALAVAAPIIGIAPPPTHAFHDSHLNHHKIYGFIAAPHNTLFSTTGRRKGFEGYIENHNTTFNVRTT